MDQRFLRLLCICLLIQLLPAGLVITVRGSAPPKPSQGRQAPGAVRRGGQGSRLLKLGHPVEGELKAGESQAYRIRMTAGQFLRVVVDQRGVNVAVALFDPDREQIVVLNGSDGEQGPESVMTIAEKSGFYYLGVLAVEDDAAAGRYEVKIEELRRATAKDFKLMAAERAFLEAEALRVRGTAESLRAAIEKYLESLPLYRAAGDRANEGIALNNIGSIYDDLDEKQKALDWYGQALQLARAVGDTAGEAATLNNICVVYDSLGRRQQALDCYLRALSLRRAARDRAGEATSLSNIGTVYDSLGEKQKALDYYQQSLQLTRAAGDRAGEGLTLNNIGKVYGDLGDVRKALDYYLKALPLHQGAQNSVGEAATLTNIGTAYDALGQKQEAIKYFLKALPLHKAAGDRSGEAATLNNLGSVYNGLGEKQRALQFYEDSLTLNRDVGDRAGEATALNNLGTIYDSQGEKQKALDSLEEALKIHQALGDRAGVASSLNSLGAVYDSLGERQKAPDYYMQALTIQRAIGDRYGEATTLHNLGAVYASLGDKQKALDWYEQAMRLRDALGDQAGGAVTLSNLGRVYGDMGDVQKALDYYLKSLPLHRAAGDRGGEAIAHNNIGTVYVSLGDTQKALDHYSQALLTFKAVGDRDGEATTLNNIGRIYDDRGDKQKARETFVQVLQIRQAIGDREGVATAHNNLGGVYDSSGDKEKALQHYSEALASFKAIGDRGGEAVALNNMGVVFWRSGDPQKALEHYSRALNLRREVGNRIGEAVTLSNIGVLQESSGEKEKALDWYGQAISAFERNRAVATLEEVKTGLAESAAETYRRAILLAQSMGRPEQAFNITERARARAFLDQLGNVRPNIRRAASGQLLEEEQRLASEVESLERRLREEQAKPASTRRAEVIDSLTNELAGAQRRLEELITQFKLTNPEYVTLRTVETLKLPDIRKLLDEDTSLISYFVTPEKTLAFLVTRDSFHHVEIQVKEKDLRAAIFAFSDFASLNDSGLESLKKLHDLLITPLKRHIRTPVIGVIPNGVLHYLPFAALTDGKHYLGEQYKLIHFPSASVLPLIKEKDKPVGTRVLAMAQSQAEGTSILQHVNKEAEVVAGLYNTRAFTNGSMSVADFTNRAGDYSIIHIAAHAELNPSNPLFSHIVLGPDKEGGGRLKLKEIYNLDLKETGLVVLSACDTNLGPYSKGDDIIGLNRAFIYAGTPAVIASLWSVDDESTSELMQAFYTSLKQGTSRAGALRAAQSAVRKKYPHPYYWGGFVLTGGLETK